MTPRTFILCLCLTALAAAFGPRALAQGDVCVRFQASKVECDPKVPGQYLITLKIVNGTTFPVDRVFLWAQTPGLVLTPDELIVPPIPPGGASGDVQLVFQTPPAPARPPFCLEVSIHNSETGECCLRTQVCPELVSCTGGPVVRRADANVDGKQDISDAIKILGYLFLGVEGTTCLKTMDSDDNAAIEITDAILLLNHLFLGGRAPPAPYPECGPDPSEDDLPCDAYPFCV